ncbi:DUF7127 family protein [Halospeciosus flavus]|uniref:Hsp20/alpha crystallin family protein n=1 Tax=Halospeciosus flavus TaxID=3032283 RepID=A0ABD5Z1L9_9EURY|nr:Hsp20/alpha crystallin family protein [Halospeciosus flavus]
MTSTRKLEQADGLVRRYDYDDVSMVVADTGFPEDALSVDVVDGTAILVVEGEDGSEQYELDVPSGEAEAFINNGVVTVEVKR